jgi:segregation and condensation protein B
MTEQTTRLNAAEREIEAILFASGEPVELERISQSLELEPKTARMLIERIRDRYLQTKSPLDVVQLNDSYQICTLPQYGEVIRRTLEFRRTPLSQAALEVLAVVAYNQPVTRAFVEQVRGVDCSSLMRSLAEKSLIEEAGRMNIPGKPIVYRTTLHFLQSFGLGSLEQLPTLPGGPESQPEEPTELEGQTDLFESD